MNNTRHPFLYKIFLFALVFTAYLFITLVVTYPLCLKMSDHIFSGLADPLAYVWNFSWAHHALFTDPFHLFHSNRLYPLAYSFATTYQPLPLQFIFSPLYAATGSQVWATNATFMATFVLCGFSMFLLMYHWTRNVPVSFVSGCVFAFSPVRLPSEQITLLGQFWSPLAVLFLDRYFSNQKLRYLIGAAVLAALQILTALETGFFLFFSLAIYVIFINRRGLWKQKRILIHIFVSAVLFVGIVYPFMYPYRVLQSAYGFKRSLGETIQFSADPISSYLRTKPENNIYGGLRLADEYNPLPGEEKIFSFVLETAGSLLGEDFIAAKLGIDKMPGDKLSDKMSYRNFFENWNREGLEIPLFQGFLTMILAFLGFRFLRRKGNGHMRKLGSIFGWIVLFGFIMSLGPVLILYGHLTYIPMPYLFFYYLFPGFSILRGVYRFMFMVSFGLSVLAGFGFFSIELAVRGPSRLMKNLSLQKYIITATVVFFVILESLSVPAPMAAVQTGDSVPEIYRWLGTRDIKGAVLEIPTIESDTHHDSDIEETRRRLKKENYREIKYLYYSTYHFKKMVNGVGSFLPPERKIIFDNLYKLPDSTAVDCFRKLNINTFIIHTDRLGQKDGLIWTEENINAMGLRQSFRDGPVIVFQFQE